MVAPVRLGTSGVLWATTGAFGPNPDSGVHAFCHAIPEAWHQMGVMLAAASSLAWFAQLTGASEASLLAELPERPRAPSPVMFLPYLAGDRTPHNDGSVRGAFAGIGFEAGRQEFTQAVLEGVAFSFLDCLRALAEAGTQITSAAVIGGGARSTLWLSILASVLESPLYRVAGAEHCTALGAARLGRKAATGMSVAELFTHPPRDDVVEPDRSLVADYAARYQVYRGLYTPLAALTRPPSPST